MAEFTFEDAMALRGLTPGEPHPRVKLSGENGNMNVLRAIAAKALRRAGASPTHIAAMHAEIEVAESYEDALGILQNYVDAY